MNLRKSKDLFGIGVLSLFFGFSDRNRPSMFWGGKKESTPPTPPTHTYLWGNG